MKRDGVVKVAKRSIKAWSKDQWVEHLADAADGFSRLAALDIPAEDAQGTGQAVPGAPILRELRESGLEGCGCLIGPVVVF